MIDNVSILQESSKTVYTVHGSIAVFYLFRLSGWFVTSKGKRREGRSSMHAMCIQLQGILESTRPQIEPVCDSFG